MNADDLLLNIKENISITIERLRDENSNIFYRVTDKAENKDDYSYEGRGDTLSLAIHDFTYDLEVYKNKLKYESYTKK